MHVFLFSDLMATLNLSHGGFVCVCVCVCACVYTYIYLCKHMHIYVIKYMCKELSTQLGTQ